jgi:hypothetical protein
MVLNGEIGCWGDGVWRIQLKTALRTVWVRPETLLTDLDVCNVHKLQLKTVSFRLTYVARPGNYPRP